MIQTILKFPVEYALDTESKNKDGYTYKGVQENIIKLQKDKEEREKLIKEQIRKEKERLAEEKRIQALREKEEIEKLRILEEQRQKLGLTLVKYRTHLFFLIFAIFMVILYLAINNATARTKKVKII